VRGLFVGLLLSILIIGIMGQFGTRVGCIYFLLAFGLGLVRLPIYIVQVMSLLFIRSHEKKHPINWDRMGVLPLPLTVCSMTSKLQNNPKNGLELISDIVANPFQSWSIQRSAWAYLEKTAAPIYNIYDWSTTAILDQYAFAPIFSSEWNSIIPAREIFFAELAGSSLTFKGINGSDFNRIPQYLTQILRCQPPKTFSKTFRSSAHEF
jgi:hypothetical protein